MCVCVCVCASAKGAPFYTFKNVNNEFVVTPISKANGNFAFICQILHVLVLINKLGLYQNTSSTNKTYMQVNITNNQVISDHTAFRS